MKLLMVVLAVALTITLSACKGETGPAGPTGSTGTTGEAGSAVSICTGNVNISGGAGNVGIVLSGTGIDGTKCIVKAEISNNYPTCTSFFEPAGAPGSSDPLYTVNYTSSQVTVSFANLTTSGLNCYRIALIY